MVLVTYRLNREETSFVLGDNFEDVAEQLSRVAGFKYFELGHEREDSLVEMLGIGSMYEVHKTLSFEDPEVQKMLTSADQLFDQAILLHEKQQEENRRRREMQDLEALAKKLGRTLS